MDNKSNKNEGFRTLVMVLGVFAVPIMFILFAMFGVVGGGASVGSLFLALLITSGNNKKL